ncbi:MAG: DUF169 domain-containing protein [Candidatus Caldarchaeales archaeon]
MSDCEEGKRGGSASSDSPQRFLKSKPKREFRLSVSADVCCLFCNAEQALFLMTATDLAIIGKPACAALAKALNEKRAVISMGCTASRTRAGYGPDELVAFIPAEKLEQVVMSLRVVVPIERKVREIAKSK